MRASAAVIDKVGGNFAMTDVDLEPAADEVIVEIAGVGLCHTDMGVQHGHLPFQLPGVLGHEGSGTVVQVGAKVTGLAVGDSVVMSFNSCGACIRCQAGEPAYCLNFLPLNFGGVRPDGTSGVTANGVALGAHYFGQSSFATHAIGNQRNVVKIPDGTPIELAGPLGCGIQTGAGAVLNALDVRSGSSIVIAGAGSVGLAAVLAAAVREVSHLIVVEPHRSRRDIALELGATHAIDPTAGDILEQVQAIVPTVDYALDTTAIPAVVGQLAQMLGVRGMLGLLGAPADPTATFALGLFPATLMGLTIRGIIEGDADPQTFIPYLLDLHSQGKFPYDKLITVMPLSEINEAVAAQTNGTAIKVVLTP